MTALATTLSPAPGEPPQGFASRLARTFDIPAAAFCADMGISFRHLADGQPDALSALAALVGRPVPELSSHVMVRRGRDAVLRGQLLTREAMRRRRLHVCPQCLTEDVRACAAQPDHAAYVRTIWLVDSIRTCQAHGMVLAPADDIEGTVIDSHDLAARVATCLPRLADMVGSATLRPASVLETYLLARIRGGDRESVPWLDGLAFHAAAKVCEMVGAVAVHGRTPNLKALTQDQWCHAGAEGFRIAAAGPDTIRDFLADLQRTYDYKAGAGPQATFGRLYQWLAFSAQGDDFEPVRALVADHLVKTVPLAAGEEVLGRTVERRMLHSIHSASIETGLHPKRLRKLLVAAGHVPPEAMTRAGGRTDHRVVFGVDACAEFLAAAGGQLSLGEAGEYLNAPRVQIKLIADHGFITPLVGAKPGWQRAYTRGELDRFLDLIARDAHDVDQPEEGMADVLKAAKAANCGAPEILRLIVDGRLDWVGRLTGTRGYMSVLVDVAEIKRITRGQELEGMPWTDLVRALRIGLKTAKALVANGILPTRTVRHPVNRCPVDVIPHSDIAAFASEYVALFALAADLGMHFRALQKTLREKGIDPCFPVDTVKSSIYRRSEVDLVLDKSEVRR